MNKLKPWPGRSLSSKHYLSVNSPQDRHRKYLLLYSLDIPYAICFHTSNHPLDSDHSSSAYSLRRNLRLKSKHLSIPWIKHQRSWGWDTSLRLWSWWSAKSLSCVQLFVTLRTVARQAPLSMGWSLPGIFLTQGSNLCLLYWQVDSLPRSHEGSSLMKGGIHTSATTAHKWWALTTFLDMTLPAVDATSMTSVQKKTGHLRLSTLPEDWWLKSGPMAHSLTQTSPHAHSLMQRPYFSQLLIFGCFLS